MSPFPRLVSILAEQRLPVIAAVQDVIDNATFSGASGSGHYGMLRREKVDVTFSSVHPRRDRSVTFSSFTCVNREHVLNLPW